MPDPLSWTDLVTAICESRGILRLRLIQDARWMAEQIQKERLRCTDPSRLRADPTGLRTPSEPLVPGQEERVTAKGSGAHAKPGAADSGKSGKAAESGKTGTHHGGWLSGGGGKSGGGKK